MISFRATEDEVAFANVVKEFAKDRIRKLAREAEVKQKVDEILIAEANELGFLSLELPEEWGGLELPLISQVQIIKELSYGDLGVLQGFTGSGDVGPLFRLQREHSQFQALKERFRSQENPTTAIVDLTNIENMLRHSVSMKKEGNGYRLNGITEPVRLAHFAEELVIFAKDEACNSLIFFLENDQWSVEDGDYRLGLLASGLGKIRFENVPVSKLLAFGKEADNLIKKFQTRHYILQAAKEQGLMEAALDYATEYTATRKAFGQEIAKFQGVSFKIAKMAIETRIVRSLVWDAALKADEETSTAYGSALRALHRAHRSVRFVTDAAVQLLGGHGFIQEFPVEKWMRDAQAQVALYGQERDILTIRGEELLKENVEVPVE
ncbi:acyl-CoA dehydrogenase family protein [Ornithinibacillus sp. 179-J 7C1 HS]|uniref:acyl-CoA dehydrogenase family protein n=1 Tax=Ornithinibacillus sp. 179-J 7C1 HS TaxID=3142384 RepID=UPI0039A18A2F